MSWRSHLPFCQQLKSDRCYFGFAGEKFGVGCDRVQQLVGSREVKGKKVANQKQLALLLKGVEGWNQWITKKNYIGAINLRRGDLSYANLKEAILSGADLREANLFGADLSGADLSDADLSEAGLTAASCSGVNLCNAYLSNTYLSGANLSGANLSGVNLSDADLGGADLSNADLSEANLSGADINSRANLSKANLSRANLISASFISASLGDANLSDAHLNGADFSGADLSGADLSGADLSGANLWRAKLSDANLSSAILFRTQALTTDFTGANFTGACLHDWNTNSQTKLDNAICEYVYLKLRQEERRPSSGKFKPGEFATLFQKVLETVDLIFADGLDWKAFFQSFQELRSHYEDDNLTIQAIEKKSGGAFVIRLEVPAESDKGAIELRAKELYEQKLQLLETQYRTELHAKDREIESYKRESANMREIAKLLASKPINVEAKAVAENQSKNVEVEMNLTGTVYGAAGKVKTMNVNASPEKQSLAEAAAEIQRLLKQLEETNPTATEAEQKAFVTAAIPVPLRKRAAAALQAGGKAAIEEFLDNPYVNVGMAIVEGWRNS